MAKVEAANRLTSPYQLFGKINVGGSGCTAQFVNHSTMLLTAAHCVYDASTKNWKQGLQFWRATDQEYFGADAWECISIPSAYADLPGSPNRLERFAYDFAWIKLRKGGPGYLGIQFGIKATGGQTNEEYGDFTAVGYPINFGNHQEMQSVGGTLGSVSLGHGLASMVGNLMLNGSSGGAWIKDDGRVIGLNSFTVSDRPGVMYSPYFGKNAERIMNFVYRGCRE